MTIWLTPGLPRDTSLPRRLGSGVRLPGGLLSELGGLILEKSQFSEAPSLGLYSEGRDTMEGACPSLEYEGWREPGRAPAQ